ncbi:MAG: glutathione peroxidase [Myxococcota bacterium]
MKMKSILFFSTIFFLLAGCDDSSSTNSNNINNSNNLNNLNNTNNVNNVQQECGNGIIEGNEICDGTKMDSVNCEDLDGYKGGMLRCGTDCSSYNEEFCFADDCPEALSFVMRTLDSTELVNLCSYKGSVIMMVNTASQCGYTYQYAKLQQIYDDYRQDGFHIFGFPANNFMNQEPGEESEIRNFINSNYGITFPMFEKISVKGSDIHPLYDYLTTETDVAFAGEITWNFNKFLLDKEGNVVSRYATDQDPDQNPIIEDIEFFLTE